MIFKLLIKILLCVYSSTAFILDNDNDVCSITKFADCSDNYLNIFNVSVSSTTVTQEALYNFYCGNNYTAMVNCMITKLDPSCGPGTDNWQMRQSVAMSDPHLFDDLCRNDTAQLDMLSCATKIPQVEGATNCFTGETLNKTVDPTDFCSFLQTSLTCSYKYTTLMCPASIPDFMKQLNQSAIPDCKIQIETSPETTSCDMGIEKACDVAYNPPQIFISTTMGLIKPVVSVVMRLFLCSSFGRSYLSCLEKVDNLCKEGDGSYLSYFPLIQQTVALCS